MQFLFYFFIFIFLAKSAWASPFKTRAKLENMQRQKEKSDMQQYP